MEHAQVFMPTGQHSIMCHIFVHKLLISLRLAGILRNIGIAIVCLYLCQTNGWELIDRDFILYNELSIKVQAGILLWLLSTSLTFHTIY